MPLRKIESHFWAISSRRPDTILASTILYISGQELALDDARTKKIMAQIVSLTLVDRSGELRHGMALDFCQLVRTPEDQKRVV